MRSHAKVREQYYVYDGASLFADIGGYLGLLLGHSVYSVLCGVGQAGSDLLRKFYSREHRLDRRRGAAVEGGGGSIESGRTRTDGQR